RGCVRYAGGAAAECALPGACDRRVLQRAGRERRSRSSLLREVTLGSTRLREHGLLPGVPASAAGELSVDRARVPAARAAASRALGASQSRGARRESHARARQRSTLERSRQVNRGFGAGQLERKSVGFDREREGTGPASAKRRALAPV